MKLCCRLALMALAWPLLFLRREPRRLLIWLGGLLAAIVLVAFQGGSITDSLFSSTGSRPPFDFQAAADVARSIVLTKMLPEGWLWILPPLPLAATALVFIWKRWWLGLMLCGYGFAGYAGFHLLHFQGIAGIGEFVRVVNLSFFALALVTPLAIALVLRDAPPWRTALAAILLLPIVLPTLTQPMASIAFDLRKGIDLRHMNTANLTYTPQITDPAVTKQLFHNWDTYHDVAQLLPANSVVLTEYPISFVIATGIPAAFAPTSDLIFFPSHRYIPDPAFYDAFWRLDPAAWRAIGALL